MHKLCHFITFMGIIFSIDAPYNWSHSVVVFRLELHLSRFESTKSIEFRSAKYFRCFFSISTLFSLILQRKQLKTITCDAVQFSNCFYDNNETKWSCRCLLLGDSICVRVFVCVWSQVVFGDNIFGRTSFNLLYSKQSTDKKEFLNKQITMERRFS